MPQELTKNLAKTPLAAFPEAAFLCSKATDTCDYINANFT